MDRANTAIENLAHKVDALLTQNLNIPKGVEHKRVKIYTGWNVGGVLRGRFSYIEKQKIVSYFLHIDQKSVKVFLPTNKTNDYDLMFMYE